MLNSIAFSRGDVSVNTSHGVDCANRLKLTLPTVVAIGAVFCAEKVACSAIRVGSNLRMFRPARKCVP